MTGVFSVCSVDKLSIILRSFDALFLCTYGLVAMIALALGSTAPPLVVATNCALTAGVTAVPIFTDALPAEARAVVARYVLWWVALAMAWWVAGLHYPLEVPYGDAIGKLKEKYTVPYPDPVGPQTTKFRNMYASAITNVALQWIRMAALTFKNPERMAFGKKALEEELVTAEDAALLRLAEDAAKEAVRKTRALQKAAPAKKRKAADLEAGGAAASRSASAIPHALAGGEHGRQRAPLDPKLAQRDKE